MAYSERTRTGLFGCLGLCIFSIACFAAWLTHVFVCLSEGKWGFLFVGAIAFPVAVVHGFGIWFGFWH